MFRNSCILFIYGLPLNAVHWRQCGYWARSYKWTSLFSVQPSMCIFFVIVFFSYNFLRLELFYCRRGSSLQLGDQGVGFEILFHSVHQIFFWTKSLADLIKINVIYQFIFIIIAWLVCKKAVSKIAACMQVQELLEPIAIKKLSMIFMLIIEPYNDWLPVGQIAQLVELCTDIAEIGV